MDAEETRAHAEHEVLELVAASLVEQVDYAVVAQDVSSSLSSKPIPCPWGFWATWLWMIPLCLAFVVAQTVVIFAYIVVQGMLAHGAGEPFDGNLLAQEATFNGLVLSLCTLATTATMVVLLPPIIWLRRMRVADYLGIDRPSGKQFALTALLVATFAVTSDLSMWLMGKQIIPEFMLKAQATAGFDPLLWLALIVVGPLGEEIVFRGFLLAPRSSQLVRTAGLILTSLAWAAVHMQYDFHGILTIFLTGLALGMIRLRTGSTTLTFWMHALLNAAATVELYAHLYLFA